jgi:hypothetical protein
VWKFSCGSLGDGNKSDSTKRHGLDAVFSSNTLLPHDRGSLSELDELPAVSFGKFLAEAITPCSWDLNLESSSSPSPAAFGLADCNMSELVSEQELLSWLFTDFMYA